MMLQIWQERRRTPSVNGESSDLITGPGYGWIL